MGFSFEWLLFYENKLFTVNFLKIHVGNQWYSTMICENLKCKMSSSTVGLCQG